MLLAQISDLHLDGTDYPAERARRVMDYLRGMTTPVDALVVTGDIADHGEISEYEEAASLLTAGFPILVLPGNHDIREPFRKVLLGEPESGTAINQLHHVAGTPIVLCDSSIPGRHDGRLDPPTLAWLDETLGTTSDRPTLVAMHHHPVPAHHPLLNEYPLRNPEDLAEVIRRHPHVAGVLIGHAHMAAASVFEGRPLIIAPSVTWALRLPWEDDQPGDRSQPPGIAFHFLDPGHALLTRFKTVL